MSGCAMMGAKHDGEAQSQVLALSFYPGLAGFDKVGKLEFASGINGQIIDTQAHLRVYGLPSSLSINFHHLTIIHLGQVAASQKSEIFSPLSRACRKRF